MILPKILNYAAVKRWTRTWIVVVKRCNTVNSGAR